MPVRPNILHNDINVRVRERTWLWPSEAGSPTTNATRGFSTCQHHLSRVSVSERLKGCGLTKRLRANTTTPSVLSPA